MNDSVKDKNRLASKESKEMNSLRAQNLFLSRRLSALESSASWQLSQEIHSLIQVVFPEGSRRWSWYVAFIHSLQKMVNSFDRVVSRKTDIHGMMTGFVDVSEIKEKPLITIIMPVYNTKEKFLDAAVQSVLAQTYRRWELIIIDDNSSYWKTLRYLKAIESNKQIRIIKNEITKGIAGAQNVGIRHAKGEFVTFLDHDDELSMHALAEVAYCIQEKKPDLIYSDEEYINTYGGRVGAYRKFGYSPDLLMAQNYFNHLTVIRRELLKNIGGLRSGFEGSQDHDMLLRVTELIDEVKIVHIPKILYRWRQHRGSFSTKSRTKKVAYDSAIKAVNEALKRRKIDGYAVVDPKTHYYRVIRKITVTPKVTIIIPFRNKLNLLKSCLESILKKTTYKNIEILCIDNRSNEYGIEEYFAFVQEKYPFVEHIKYSGSFNFSKINNWAVQQAKGEYIVFLNNDTEIISSQWIEEMLQQAIRPDVAFVGAMLLYPNNTVQHAGVVLGLGGAAGHIFTGLKPLRTYFHLGYIIRDVSAVTGACMMIRKSTFDTLGGFDPKLAVAFNDVEVCIRALKSGYRNIYTPYAQLYHYESASRGYEDTPQKKERHDSEVKRLLDLHADYISKGDPHIH